MKITALVNRKGGVTKSTSTVNLGVGLVRQGKRVLLVDTDSQANLTQMLGWSYPNELPATLSTAMMQVIQDKPPEVREAILHHWEGIDLLPASSGLADVETSLVNAMSRESVLAVCLEQVRRDYDCILIDCPPSMGMITVNALTAADSVLIPVQAEHLAAKGLELVLGTIHQTQRRLNPKLKIDGLFLTLTSGTNFCRETREEIHAAYGAHLRIFKAEIPRAVKGAEISAMGKSIFRHNPSGEVAAAYEALTKEVLTLERSKKRNGPETVR